MSIAKEIFESTEPLTKTIGFKVNESTLTTLRKVYYYRNSKGLDKDFSEFLRKCLMVALMLDNPTEYLPKFDIPNLETLLTESTTDNAEIGTNEKTELETNENSQNEKD